MALVKWEPSHGLSTLCGDAEAKLKDGVLEIKIPKSEKAKVKDIPVQA